MIEFQGWPKTPRLFRDMIVTEKIDGTNAAVIIDEFNHGQSADPYFQTITYVGDQAYTVGAQSRKRLISPKDDNFGFASWVFENADSLASILGPGRHFGEWWGSGIQRGYGLQNGDRRFSLFNVKRYADLVQDYGPALSTVPVLSKDLFDLDEVARCLGQLRLLGSVAAPGFMNPEGIVVFHEASGHVFKATLDNDGEPKSLARAA
jgi:hypothetical protein